MVQDPSEHGGHDERLGHPVPFDQREPLTGVELGKQDELFPLVEGDEEPERAADVEGEADIMSTTWGCSGSIGFP